MEATLKAEKCFLSQILEVISSCTQWTEAPPVRKMMWLILFFFSCFSLHLSLLLFLFCFFTLFFRLGAS